MIIKNNYTGIGKRKSSLAKVSLTSGSGQVILNNNVLDATKYPSMLQKIMFYPLLLLNLKDIYNIFINVSGGGIMSQARAIQLALSKALCNIDPLNRVILNQETLLKSDSRIKERRKYGLKKARKAPQYSKR
jgi:small subunit ribosomal protein S9